MLSITDMQYKEMRIFVGEKKNEEIISGEQLLLF
jgi:CRISPR/Cas system-associated protein endoribonuclease Cas2